MPNEELIRKLIQGSIHRALQESIAALVVVIAFGTILHYCEVGTPRYYGCLMILIGTGLVVGVVWSCSLTSRLLQIHPATDTRYWREVFHSQARVLRQVPLWYCAPLGLGCLVFVTPTATYEFAPFLLVAGIIVSVIGAVIWLNRRGAESLEATSRLLKD